jgi:hypothetical protein
MKRKELTAKLLAAGLVLSMTVNLCPMMSQAASNGDEAADSTYISTVTVDETDVSTVEVSEDVNTVMEDGEADNISTEQLEALIEQAADYQKDSYTQESWEVFQEALDAAKAALEAKESQDKVDEAATALSTAIDGLEAAEEEEYKYVYAGLTWAEYWANEDVYAAGSTESSDETDFKGEYDKGAFDAVTRATTNHGLHRGSYQCTATITLNDGTTYDVAYYTGQTTVVLTDGTEVTYEKSDIASYVVTGLKYVPVKVASEDYEAFCEAYTVVENGDTLSGGFSEDKLSAYTDVVAEVTEDTNGLKTATKNPDGSFSFSARATGTDSGIKDVALKTATGIEPTVSTKTGSYGEFLRVDLNGDYGDLGANMQSVEWTYYGNDSSYSTPLQTYGTKFAADNWMHKSNGIQLGLTKSLRCQLPEDYDGTGYWTLTVHALGYEDYTYQFQATAANLAEDDEDDVLNTDSLKQAIDAAKALQESDYTADSWASMQTELKEAEEELAAPKTQATIAEAASHLNAAVDSLAYYILMNIPYDEFYTADLRNDVRVDVFTSATKTKTRTGSLAGGSYHVDSSGEEITGITFPVKVTKSVDLSAYKQVTDADSVEITVTNRGQASTTTYTGKAALFEAATYSYYVLGGSDQSYYKELTVTSDGSFTFGKVNGTVETVSGVDAELTTETTYGDYQLDLDGFDQVTAGTDDVYAVIVSTDDHDYGLRHLENIWRVSELAWCTGFTDAIHNCPTDSEHYASMMGETIKSVTYYTSKGIYQIPLDVYVPVKFEGSVSVDDAAVTAGTTAMTVTGLPEDYDAEYTVEGLSVVKAEDGVLTFNSDAKPGSYTLNVSDKSGKYTDLSASFILNTTEIPAAYNNDKTAPALIAADGYTEEEVANFIKNISSVSVNGTAYASSGRGAAKIINADGSLITDATVTVSNVAKALFEAGAKYNIEVSATGYDKVVSFVYSTVDTSALESAISKTTSLKESTYTTKTWSALKTALQDAEAALDADTQDEVDTAAKALETAISNLTCKSHTYKVTKTTKATTDKNGSVVSTCSVCGTKKTTTVYAAKTISLSKTSYVYSGKVQKPTVTVKDSKGNKIATSNYTVTYATGRKNVGTYKVTVKFKGNYSGSKTLTFTILPKATTLSKLTATSKGFTVKWAKQATQTTGYQIQYSTSSKFTSAKTVTISKNSTVSKTVSKLTANKKYYVRVRTYKTVNGKKIYSSWSAAKNVTTKK